MNNFEKFQELLKSIFQFETADLDFGIYRILNYKRKQIEKFINEDLKNKVEITFNRRKDERLKNIDEEFEKVKEEVTNTLGNNALTSTGDIKDEFKNIPLGIKFTTTKVKKEEADKIDEIKDTVFNDLYKFFSRYYEEGDFIPQYRYSIKGHKYAIPYNGEEIKLYWANYDQYYIKTGLLFRDYTFKAENYKIIFRAISAKEELGSNKATKQRFFILDDENPIEEKDNEVIIRFQYRELFEGENILKIYNQKFKKVENTNNDKENGKNENKIKLEKLNLIINQEIIHSIKNDAIKHFLQREYKEDSKGNSISLLNYHLDRFTAKNTKDYFIHRDLKKFLSEQLDYFIKAEVLDIETIEKEKFLDKHITRAKVVREIGEVIIDFLSQIENFQKRLWEKKKFVIKTEYVITTDRIPEEFYNEIWQNKELKKEWEELGFEIPKKKEDLKNTKLPIDTKYFSSEFKEKLLEKLSENDDLDDLLDGLLIKSENWQALNTILNKYKGSIKTIYIDPPYNTGSDEFLYRDRYQHSSWLTMIENKLELSLKFLKNNGIFFSSIANNAKYYYESAKLNLLFENIFPKRIGELIWKRRSGSGSNTIQDITEMHEYILCFGNEESRLNKNILAPKEFNEYKHKDERGIYKWNDTVINQYTKIERPNLYYAVLYNFIEDKIFFDTSQANNKNTIKIYPSENGNSVFFCDIESMKEIHKRGILKVFKEKNGEYKLKIKKYLYNIDGMINGNIVKSILEKTDTQFNIGGTSQGTRELKDLFSNEVFKNPKPSTLVSLLIYISTKIKDDKNYILDFFAGSGTTAHAVMKLNKEYGGNRKFILIDMANYFETVIIPRIKKVSYSFNWKDGEPQDKDGIGVFFKYQYLEQYEDSLDNIELEENKKAEELFKDEYLIKYFLDFETKNNPYLLNIEELKNPFSYKLKVNLSEVGEPQEVVVDIPETFNYLLGIKIKKIKKRKNNGKDYLFILGEKEGQTYVIVWRELSGDVEEAEQDKDFIKKELEDWKPQIVYVNCPENTVLTPDFGDFQVEIRYIEPEFKKLMETNINYED